MTNTQTNQTNQIIHLTDRSGRTLVDRLVEPNPGSIVMTDGLFGMAWQRHFSDGLWYRSGKSARPQTWGWLLTQKRLVLMYDAPERKG